MGVDLEIVFATAVSAEEAFALPARLNRAPAVVAACSAYYEQSRTRLPGLVRREWAWDKHMSEITAPSGIVEAWAPPHGGSIWLSGVPGSLLLRPDQIRLSSSANLSGFASNYEGCQEPIRRVCRAVGRELGADRVLYFPDSDWPREAGNLCDTRFDDIIERLTAWGPPVSEIGALPYGRAVRGDYHYADGALRRRDGTAVSEAEIVPGYNWIRSGEITTYHDGTLVPPEELARPDLRGGFAYYIDDFRDLA